MPSALATTDQWPCQSMMLRLNSVQTEINTASDRRCNSTSRLFFPTLPWKLMWNLMATETFMTMSDVGT